MRIERETIIDHDDITVLNSQVILNDEGNLEYLLYDILIKDNNGAKIKAHKVIKLLRTIKLPKSVKQETNFMAKHSELLGGIWEGRINLIGVIANILEPEPIGLLYCYGVQVVAENLEEAKKIADEHFDALQGALQGCYRTMEYRSLNSDEIGWLREKINSMKNLSIVRGLPQAKNAPGEAGMGIGKKDNNDNTMETTEELIAGMSDKEYVIMTISSPVKEEVLSKWLNVCSKENTKWQSQMQGSSGMNFGLNIPMVFAGNLGANEGWSEGSSESESFGESLSESDSTSFSESFGTSQSSSYGESDGWSTGDSSSSSYGTGKNFGEGTSNGTSTSESESLGTSTSDSIGNNYGTSYGTSEGYSNSHSEGDSYSVSEGINKGVSYGESTSISDSHSTSTSQSTSYGYSHSEGGGSSIGGGTSNGYNHSTNSGYSYNWGSGTNSSTGNSSSIGSSTGESYSNNGGIFVSGSTNSSYSDSTSQNESYSINSGTSEGHGFNVGYTNSENNSNSNSYNNSTSYNNGYSSGISVGYGISHGESYGTGTSYGISYGESYGISKGISSSDSFGYSSSISKGTSEGFSTSHGTGASYGISKGTGTSEGTSSSYGTSISNSNGTGTSSGLSGSTSYSTSSGSSYGISNGTGHSTGTGVSWGNSRGTSSGFSSAMSSGMSASMGVGLSVGINKTYQFIDVEVRNIVQIYEQNTARLMTALNGEGAFFVDLYVATPNDEVKAAATTLAKSAWQNEQALFCPLQVIDLEGEELQHMLYHFAAFSSCNTKEGIKGSIQSYKYSTVLLSSELTAYTHPIRLSEGGQYVDIEDIPILAIPPAMEGEIYLGKVLSGERWVLKDGYKTKIEYRLNGAENMHHIFFSGESRSGKTVMATRFVVETALKTKRYGKRMRIIVLDPKQDWRVLSKFIESTRFRFYSLGNPEFLPIKLNLLKIPKNVRPQTYADGIIESFCRSYQLGEKVKPILRDAIYKSYEEAGCFEANWKEVAPDYSRNVSFAKVYRKIRKKMEDLKAMRATPNMIEAYERLLDRLDMFSKDYTVEYKLFGQGGPEALGIDEILGEDDVIVLESFGLDNTFKSFVFGVITTSIWYYCYAHEGGFKADDQYSTLLVIEEANEVLIGGDDSTVQGTSMFEKIVDQAAGLELFICAITQKIADMPPSIIANTGLAFSMKISREEDKMVFMNKIGKDDKIDDKNILKFLPKMPTGWCIAKAGRTFNYKDAEPVLLSVDKLDVDPPTNEELLASMQEREIQLEIERLNNDI